MTTCMDSSRNFAYMMNNLVAEVGEFAGKVAKAQRKGKIKFNENGDLVCNFDSIEEMREFWNELKKEAGDILWQHAGLCEVMDWDLETIGAENLQKLASRQRRGKIDGEGDNR